MHVALVSSCGEQSDAEEERSSSNACSVVLSELCGLGGVTAVTFRADGLKAAVAGAVPNEARSGGGPFEKVDGGLALLETALLETALLETALLKMDGGLALLDTALLKMDGGLALLDTALRLGGEDAGDASSSKSSSKSSTSSNSSASSKPDDSGGFGGFGGGCGGGCGGCGGGCATASGCSLGSGAAPGLESDCSGREASEAAGTADGVSPEPEVPAPILAGGGLAVGSLAGGLAGGGSAAAVEADDAGESASTTAAMVRFAPPPLLPLPLNCGGICSRCRSRSRSSSSCTCLRRCSTSLRTRRSSCAAETMCGARRLGCAAARAVAIFTGSESPCSLRTGMVRLRSLPSTE